MAAAVALAAHVRTPGRAEPFEAWRDAQSRGGAWRGACAFCAYAEGQQPGAPPTCRGAPCPEGTRLLPSRLQERFVCFDNHREPRDRLCIARDFEAGGSNVESLPHERRQAFLRELLEAAGEDASARGAAPRYACLNPRSRASVPWTHVHLFEDGVDPEGVLGHAYCAELESRHSERPSPPSATRRVKGTP